MPADDPDLSAADEYSLGHLHGTQGQVPAALVHPDPVYAANYREGYLAGRREARAAAPRSNTDTAADDLPL